MSNGFTLEQAFGEPSWIGEIPSDYATAFSICFNILKGHKFNWDSFKFEEQS